MLCRARKQTAITKVDDLRRGEIAKLDYPRKFVRKIKKEVLGGIL